MAGNGPLVRLLAACHQLVVAELFAPWLRRIRPDGIATLVTGGPGSTSSFNNGAAIKAQVNFVTSLDLTKDGALLVAESDGRYIRQISADGFIRTVIGMPGGPPMKEGDLAAAVDIYQIRHVAAAPDGSVYVSSGNLRIYRVAPALPGLALGQFFVPSTDGSEFYVFGVDGRHISTSCCSSRTAS